MSVICAQVKKDCVSIRNKDGSEEKVQKGLRLATISEIYANFKAEFPSLKIGFSTFALLRSKWYMSVDVAGSHNVCMHLPSKCKTFLNTVNISLNYNDVLKLCVFSTENSDCMLHHCDLCPEQTVAYNILKEQLLLNYIFGDLVKYKQWVSTDRSNLEQHMGDLDYFLDKLTSMFFELIKHHFIAKKQSEFLRVKNASLKFDEAVLILNFAENYSFVCVRLYPKLSLEQCSGSNPSLCFILFKSRDKKASSVSFSCICDHMTRNTITVHAFLKTLINDHIKTRYPFLKSKSYFSDCYPAQYKKYKNFTNLLMRKKYFGMKAV